MANRNEKIKEILHDLGAIVGIPELVARPAIGVRGDPHHQAKAALQAVVVLLRGGRVHFSQSGIG